MEPSYALILANQDFSQVTETANQILLSATQSRGNMHKLKYKNLFHLNIKWGKNPTFFLYYSSVQILSRFVENCGISILGDIQTHISPGQPVWMTGC